MGNRGQEVRPLQGSRVLLRGFEERDKGARLASGRHAEEVRMYGGDTGGLAPLTAEDVDRWYAALASQPHAWAAEVDGRCIGTARLHSLNEHDRRARYAVGIFQPALWSRGYGTEVTRLALRYAFGELGVHRVDLRVLEYNQRAIACYEKCGFVREGVERESALVDGVWYSDVMMSILEHEYRAIAGSDE